MTQAPAAPREDRLGRAVGLMTLAVACFTAIDTSAKWLVLAGLPVLQVVFARYAGHFLVSLAVFLPEEGTAAFRARDPLRQGLRAAFLLGSTVFNFAALRHLPLSVTTTIFFAGPIVVTLLSMPMLGERVGIRRLLAILTGFAGVLIVVRPWGAAWDPAMLLSLGALVCASLYFVMTRRLAGVESNATSQLWASGIAVVALAPVALPVWTWPATTAEWIVLTVIGGFGATGHILLTAAHRFAPASTLAPVVYTQILFASVAGALVFGAWPTPWTLLGAAVIVASGLYIWRRETALRAAEAPKPEPPKPEAAVSRAR